MTCVLFPHKFVDSIRAHMRATTSGNEQGGLLLGYRKPNAIELCNVTFPTLWDRSSSTRFNRSQRGHRIRALREWLISRRTIDWIGEWHTHPGGRAAPSFIDLQTWRQLARHQAKPMIILIFSDRDMYAGIHDGKEICKLALIESDDFGILFG